MKGKKNSGTRLFQKMLSSFTEALRGFNNELGERVFWASDTVSLQNYVNVYAKIRNDRF